MVSTPSEPEKLIDSRGLNFDAGKSRVTYLIEGFYYNARTDVAESLINSSYKLTLLRKQY